MATYPKFDFLDVAEIASILASVVLIAYAVFSIDGNDGAHRTRAVHLWIVWHMFKVNRPVDLPTLE